MKTPEELKTTDSDLAFKHERKAKEATQITGSPVIDNLDASNEEYLAHLAAIIEFSEDAIISKSIDGIIKSWNKGSEKMFGFTAQEAIGKHISIIFPKEYHSEEKSIIEKITNNEIIDHFETVRNKKNGESLYVSLTASPLRDRSGTIIGVSKIIRDISSHKKSKFALIRANKALVYQNEEKEKRAAELAAANFELALQNDEKENRAAELLILNNDLEVSENRLKEVNSELESFSYSVSHDLRAPLRAIHGYTMMLERNFEKKWDAESKRLMNKIMSNAKKMGMLIDDLLSFSRVGRKELVMVNIQMQEIVTNICTELKNEQPTRKIKFHIRTLLPVMADNMGIKQVWLNLISNAVKYSRLKENAIIEIGCNTVGDEIVYYIKDNGAGYDMRYADKLFGVFQRLHAEEEFEGTGVGLAIVQRIISKHGGRVWAEAVVNEGATFYFSLIK